MADFAEDPVLDVLELEEGVLKPSEDGFYTYYIPSDKELLALNEIGTEIEQAISDNAGLYEKADKALRAYEAIPENPDDPLVLPMVKTDCNQTIALAVNTCLQPRPIVSVDAVFPGEYEVPVPDPVYGSTVMLPVDGEVIGRTAEHALDHKLLDKLGVSRIFDELWTDALTGQAPTWATVFYYDQARLKKAAKFKKGARGYDVEYDGEREYRVLDDELVRIETRPLRAVIMPANEDDPNLSPWVSERTPYSNAKLRSEISSFRGEKACLIPEADDEKLYGEAAVKTRDDNDSVLRGEIQGRVATQPRPKHDIHLVWFRHPLRYKVPSEMGGKKKTRVQLVEMCGLYHFTLKRFIAIWLNPYRHQERPYIWFMQRKRPRQLSGGSLAEDTYALQQYITAILNETLRNAQVANSTPIRIDPDSDAVTQVAKDPVEPATVLFARKDEIESISFGANMRSQMPEVDWLAAQFARASNLPPLQRGDGLLGRTPSSSVEQVMTAGQQQLLQAIRLFGEQWSKVMRLWIHTYKQFVPEGEFIPSKDPETGAVLELAFRLPAEEVLDKFRITLTAADQLLAKEHELEQIMMLLNVLDQDAQQVSAMIGPFADTQMPPSLAAVLERLIERKQTLLEELFANVRTDTKKLIVTKDMLRTIDQEREAMRQQMQQQAAMEAAQQGGGQMPPQEGAMNGQGGPGVPDPSQAVPMQ